MPMKMLVAVDGSEHALAAVRHTVDVAGWYREKPTVELVFVHLPLPYLSRVKSVVGAQEIERYYEEEGKAALAAATSVLEASGISHTARILVGPVAESIVEHAGKTGCGLIVVASRGMGAAGNLLLGSVTTRIVHISDRPVLVVK